MNRIPDRRESARLPLQQAWETSRVVPDVHDAPAHLLLVGDELYQHQNIPLSLAQAGHRLTRAADWQQALEQLEMNQDLELIICNRTAPDPAGMGLVHYLAQPHLLSSLPVIVICQEADLHSLTGLLAEGTIDFLNDPFSPRELVIRVRKSLVQYRSTQQNLRSTQRDSLTGLFSKGAFVELLPREMGRARRGEFPLGLLYADLDNFRQINETRGHLTGNQMLQVFAKRLSLWVREGDLVARYGGEEFVILAPGAGPKGISIMGQRIRQCMEEEVHTRAGYFRVTISLGAAVYEGDEELSPGEFLNLAEKACYQAKAQGRNCLVLAS